MLWTRRLRTADVIMALQELATMLTSGVPIVDAVGSQAISAHHPRIVEAFTAMSRDLQRGQAFSATLAASGLPLPDYVVQLARAGELTVWAVLVMLIVGITVFVIRTTPRMPALSRRLGAILFCLFIFQMIIGVVNVWLMAPVWIQVVHLLITEVIWICLVIFAASTLRSEGEVAGENAPASVQTV